jgi:hypothetical protein
MTKKIIQIIPGGGWKAVYADAEGNQNSRDVICWAVTNDDGETSVEGMIAEETVTRFVTDDNKFAGYQTPTGQYDLTARCKTIADLIREKKLR